MTYFRHHKRDWNDNDCVRNHCGYSRYKCGQPEETPSNEVLVSFGSEGQPEHYLYQNEALADQFGGDVVALDNTPDNVTGGIFTANDPNVDEQYSSDVAYDEAYFFSAFGWNIVKNISVAVSGDKSILFTVDNFVHADMDFSQVRNDVELRILDAKRSNVVTGCGDDIINITSASNSDYWSNTHKIETGAGDDIVTIGYGEEALLHYTPVNFIDGRLTSVEVDLGKGNDTFKALDGVLSEDTIFGGKGNDTISTGNGDDTIEGGKDKACIFEICDDFYWLLAGGDTLEGGAGADTFIYNTYEETTRWGKQKDDGFDHILDFSDEDVLVLNLQDGDVVETQEATVGSFGGFHNGTMVSINGEAAVFLEDYTNASEIFV